MKTDYLGRFFASIHPQIVSPYILVTHNSDDGAPGPFARYLEDDKILAWFAQNVDGTLHPKLHPIPIGCANQEWSHGNISLIKQQQERLSSEPKDIILYMNFSPSTYATERNLVFSLFADKPYCTISSPKGYASYLKDLARARFVLSPRGNGLDTHRTWESLLMGAIPIVRTSPLDPLYKDLPVVIVQDWTEVSEAFLQEKYAQIQSRSYSMDAAYIYHWLSQIDTYKRQAQGR